MTQEEKELLLQDLCARLPYGVIIKTILNNGELIGFDTGREELHLRQLNDEIFNRYYTVLNDDPKPYLRPMSSMTEEEAKEIAILHGVKNILSIKITDEYINITVDDGFSSIDTITIWYDEIVSSIESFDWLNKKMFDYRGLISIGLAIEAPENIYKDEKKI